MVMAFTISRALCTDLCSDSTDPVCRCIFDYADQYSAIPGLKSMVAGLDRVTGLT